jgi:eukaryotic-like serine/threonine-protein kinase
LYPGDVLDDRYRLDEPIAGGGMGDVWRGTDLALGRVVAVKALRPALATDPGFDARFRAEARTMAALAHPNVVNVYDYGHSPGPGGDSVPYLVMGYVEGRSLADILHAEGRLPVDRTLPILAQAAEALHAAHERGIVHRDVKPANLLVRPDGTVVLVDFGVARASVATTAATGQAVLGTAMYMAPEQASGQPVGPATDVYALGAVGYHCLAGYPPFDGQTPLGIALRHVTDEPPPLPEDIPAPVRDLVFRALAKDPRDRPPSAAAFAAEIRGVRHLRSAVDTVPLAGAVAPPRRANRRLLGATLALLLVSLTGVALLVAALVPQSHHLPGTTPGGPASSVPPSSPAVVPQGGGGQQAGQTGVGKASPTTANPVRESSPPPAAPSQAPSRQPSQPAAQSPTPPTPPPPTNTASAAGSPAAD